VASLSLRYTRVSGSGEDFSFQEGTVPASATRVSDREWRLSANLDVTALELDPGDVVVYRAVAADTAPGAREASSDTYFVEIAGPGQVPLAGVALPPDQERYALSQQMIVIKIERLRQREAAMTRAAVTEEAADIAAEQRAVRANFIFLMGGHVEDEEVEAEQSSEIQEGRLQNTARQDIVAAMRQMTRAETGLAQSSPSVALPPAKLAAAALQRAFGRNRYLLRMLPVRSALDPSRRLTGDTSKAASWMRERASHEASSDRQDAVALAGALERISAGAQASHAIDTAGLSAAAEHALRLAATSAAWQKVATPLVVAARSSSAEDVVARVNEAIRALGAITAADAAAAGDEGRVSRLKSRWAAAGGGAR
jgi:hypothetical protein